MPTTDPALPPQGPPSTIVGAPTSVTAFVDFFPQGPSAPTAISSLAQLQQIFGPPDPRCQSAIQIQQFLANGGRDPIVLRLEPAPDDPAFVPALSAALTSLADQPGLFQLLCLPCTANLAPADALAILHQAQTLCASIRALLLIDPPASAQSVDAMGTWISAAGLTASSNSAVFFPRLDLPHSLTQIGPCGSVAGIISRTDALEGVWKSPAGPAASIAGAAPSILINDAQGSTLNSLAINCIRTFPSIGAVLWGARTTQGTDAQWSDFKYIPVRRLMDFIESSLSAGLSFVAFEPNTAVTWVTVQTLASTFLTNLFLSGALAGNRPEEAFRVECGLGSTMTAQDILDGRLNVQVIVAPVRPAEFLIVTLSFQTASATT